jgi:hypothetical protein
MKELREALAGAVRDLSWLDDALRRVQADPAAIASIFPAAGRHCGRDTPLSIDGWVAQDAARVLLLLAAPDPDIESLYRYGDAAEKRAVLKALPLLPIGDRGVSLLQDAIRTNDTRLVAAALGPYAVHLDDATWRQAIVKCVLMGVPLSVVHGLDGRADAELATMLAGLAEERRAAGRDMPADATELLQRLGA